MNYLKHYCNLIRKAEKRGYTKKKAKEQNVYIEGHHTFPVSIFGKNKRIVYLTAREHYIAHALLEKCCVQRYGENNNKTIKMRYAFWCMNNQKTKNTYLNSYLYECYKKKFSDLHKNVMLGNKHSEKTKEKMSISAKGKIKSEEHRKNISIGKQGHKQNPETIKKRVMKNKGKKRTDEQKMKISIAHKGKVIPKKSLEKRTNSFCKNIYTFISPDGVVVETYNARKFCRENNLQHTAVYKVCKDIQKHHKGWKITRRPRTDADK